MINEPFEFIAQGFLAFDSSESIVFRFPMSSLLPDQQCWFQSKFNLSSMNATFLGHRPALSDILDVQIGFL